MLTGPGEQFGDPGDLGQSRRGGTDLGRRGGDIDQLHTLTLACRSDTVATNVPGPRKRVRIMEREVIRLLPIPPLAMQLRTGIAIMSYADHLVFGIIGDYDAAPDVDELANGIERAVVRLTSISAGHWRSTPVGTLALVQGG